MFECEKERPGFRLVSIPPLRGGDFLRHWVLHHWFTIGAVLFVRGSRQCKRYRCPPLLPSQPPIRRPWGLGAPLDSTSMSRIYGERVTSCVPNLGSPSDGLPTALVVLDLAARSGESLEEFVADLKVFPQIIVDVKVREKRASVPSPPSPLLSMERKKTSRTLAASSSVTGAQKRWRAS